MRRPALPCYLTTANSTATTCTCTVLYCRRCRIIVVLLLAFTSSSSGSSSGSSRRRRTLCYDDGNNKWINDNTHVAIRQPTLSLSCCFCCCCCSLSFLPSSLSVSLFASRAMQVLLRHTSAVPCPCPWLVSLIVPVPPFFFFFFASFFLFGGCSRLFAQFNSGKGKSEGLLHVFRFSSLVDDDHDSV